MDEKEFLHKKFIKLELSGFESLWVCWSDKHLLKIKGREQVLFDHSKTKSIDFRFETIVNYCIVACLLVIK